MKKNYEGKRMDSNRKIKKERRTHRSNSFKFNFDVKKFLRITSKTLATTWIVALVIFFIFIISITPGVFDILNTRNKADAAMHSTSVSSEVKNEKQLAYENKVKHYVESVNNMQNANVFQKLQNSAMSSVAQINAQVNENVTITAVEFYEIAVVAFPLLVFATLKIKKIYLNLLDKLRNKNIKKLETKVEPQLLVS